MAVVDVEELAKKQGLKPNLQLFAEEEPKLVKVGRWMCKKEYENMIKTGKVQMSNDNKVHVVSPPNMDSFGKQAPKNSLYVEFEVPSNTISNGGADGWKIINGPGSLLDRLNEKKGLPKIEDMPNALNIVVKGEK